MIRRGVSIRTGGMMAGTVSGTWDITCLDSKIKIKQFNQRFLIPIIIF
jgi:hypothetical protein